MRFNTLRHPFAPRWAALLCVSVTALSVAQSPKPPAPHSGSNPKPAVASQTPAPTAAPHEPYGVLHLQTAIGSFKIKSMGDTPAEGTVDMSFEGTVLVSQLQPGGTVTPSGDVKLEYDRKDRNKAVYFGKGRLVVKGKFAGLQWFGQNLKATFTGEGPVFLAGEFDKSLNTGLAWWGNDSTHTMYWGTGGLTVTTHPFRVEQTTAKPKIKDVTGKG